MGASIRLPALETILLLAGAGLPFPYKPLKFYQTVMLYPVQDFKKFPTYGSYGLEPNATDGRNIETIAIDDLEIDREISFMKVDVQGSDLFAMQGAIETIKKYKMPIIFEFEQQFQKEFNTCFQDYLDFIASINYKVEEVIYDINYLIVPKHRS